MGEPALAVQHPLEMQGGKLLDTKKFRAMINLARANGDPMTTPRILFRASCTAAVLAALLAGCTTSDGDGGQGEASPRAEAPTPSDGGDGEGQVTSMTFLIPFPSALTFYSFHVAERMGYLEEEGIELRVEAADGTSNVIQQIAAGNAETGYVTAAGQMGASIEDQELVSYYVLAPGLPFGLLTSSDSGIAELSDLDGATIGVSSPTGGENYYVQAMLNAIGVDATVTPVGGAGEAELAFQRGQISAYATATTDLVGIARLFEEDGLEAVELGFGEFDQHFGGSMATTADRLEASPAAYEGLARAFTKGTIWGMENPDGVLAIIQDEFPEQVTDCDAARSLLAAHFAARQPTAAMGDKWGPNVEETWASVSTLLFEQGALGEQVDTTRLFTNDLIDDINDFDLDAVRSDAANFTESPAC